MTRADVIRAASDDAATTGATNRDETARGGLLQTVVVVGALLAAGVAGYAYQARALLGEAAAAPAAGAAPAAPGNGTTSGTTRTGNGTQATAPTSKLGDLSQFRTITQDTRDLVDRGDQPGATTRVTDLEAAWDDSEARLKPRGPAAWTAIDGKIDTVLRGLRSTHLDAGSEEAALDALLAAVR